MRGRIYGYIETDRIERIEDSDYTKSGFVREAIQEKLEREGMVE